MTKKRRGQSVNHARAMEIKAAQEAAETALQEKGTALFKEYYHDGAYARAKLDGGMRFTPELVKYLDRAVKNRRVAEEIRKENTKDIPEDSDNEHAETDFDSGNVAAGPSWIAGAADGCRAADDAGAGGSTKHPAAGSPRGGAA